MSKVSEFRDRRYDLANNCFDLINPLAPFLLKSHARMAPIARFEKKVLFWRASGFTGQANVSQTLRAGKEKGFAKVRFKLLLRASPMKIHD